MCACICVAFLLSSLTPHTTTPSSFLLQIVERCSFRTQCPLCPYVRSTRAAFAKRPRTQALKGELLEWAVNVVAKRKMGQAEMKKGPLVDGEAEAFHDEAAAELPAGTLVCDPCKGNYGTWSFMQRNDPALGCTKGGKGGNMSPSNGKSPKSGKSGANAGANAGGSGPSLAGVMAQGQEWEGGL